MKKTLVALMLVFAVMFTMGTAVFAADGDPVTLVSDVITQDFYHDMNQHTTSSDVRTGNTRSQQTCQQYFNGTCQYWTYQTQYEHKVTTNYYADSYHFIEHTLTYSDGTVNKPYSDTLYQANILRQWNYSYYWANY